MNFHDFGFIRIGAATPDIKKANITENTKEIIRIINTAEENKVGLLVLPEFVVTGAGLGDLFAQKQLLDGQKKALREIAEATEGLDITVVLGAYKKVSTHLDKTVYIIQNGEFTGAVANVSIAQDEKPYFSQPPYLEEDILFDEANGISMGLSEKCDIQMIVTSEDPMVGQYEYNKSLAKMLSGKNNNIVVMSGLNGTAIIAENGQLLEEKKPFEEGILTIADCDLEIIAHDRMKAPSVFELDLDVFPPIEPLALLEEETELYRNIRPNPFEPETEEQLLSNCYEIFEIQADALAKRLAHTHSKVSVVGISGGLDSTLALLVTAYAHKKLNKPAKDIIAVTMPGFGTTGRTYENALSMMKSVGATVKEISIVDAVTQHFKDIEHDMDVHDITYENSQARERTQILMDIANQEGGIVIGTGDLSEEALGWCTFNGDHISMFGVNAGIPKTVIKFIVRWFIDVKLKEDLDFSEDNELLARTLEDILDTPISPELLPPDEDGNIAQKTEDNVGPYELHDFFIFHTARYGVTPQKLLFLAKTAFEGKYDEEFITKWMKVFYRRFFAQQFKRSCSPDSPQIGTIDLSPAHWKMPSDAFAEQWLNQLD